MSAGDVALEQMLAKLRQLPELAERAAPEVAHVVREELERQISKGTDPNGKAWKKTLDGRQPLIGAAKALGVTAIGPRVIAVLRGPEARHHLGRARGGIVREVLPGKEIPRAWSGPIKRALANEFQLTMESEK